ncbi:hypothetical protein KCM76_02300 [Zooshikella marina]|uniref:hypothetical protein n=1 Tax=Zooshikella ganghwensis TaxID=202772 RepID=UPI001BAF8B94|nr:hypothetical protein [Zooshikella ganghwensis]MBU2704793.1 hypothetical protein [Zooshikella ganghwensis]
MALFDVELADESKEYKAIDEFLHEAFYDVEIIDESGQWSVYTETSFQEAADLIRKKFPHLSEDQLLIKNLE